MTLSKAGLGTVTSSVNCFVGSHLLEVHRFKVSSHDHGNACATFLACCSASHIIKVTLGAVYHGGGGVSMVLAKELAVTVCIFVKDRECS